MTVNFCDVFIVSAWLIVFGDGYGYGGGGIEYGGDGNGDGDFSEPEVVMGVVVVVAVVVVVVGRISGTSQCLAAHKPPLYPPPAMLCIAQYRGSLMFVA